MTAKIKEPLPPQALSQEEMADSTREQQESHVRVVPLTCRGRLMYDPEDEQKSFKKWYALRDANDDVGARRFIGKLVDAAQEVAAVGVTVRIGPLPEAEGDWFALRQIAFPLIRLRGQRVGFRCGVDLVEEILKHPFDGAEHETVCSGCGTPQSWKAPIFN